MVETIMIDGRACEIVQTDSKYENLVPVKNGSLSGCWHRKQKCLVDGWRDTNNIVYGRSFTGKTQHVKR